MESEFKEITRQPEKREETKEPKISFQILYSSHRTAKDFEKLAEVFPKADVYVPEHVGWTPETSADFRALSQGERTPRELKEKYGWQENSDWAKECEIIYQSQKPILFVDIGEGHELEKIDQEAERFYGQSRRKFKDGNFSEALQTMRNCITKSAEYDLAREEIIKANLETKVKELIKNDPRFFACARGASALGGKEGSRPRSGKNKKEIKVLLSLGAVHTRIHHSLEENEPLTKRQFSNLPLVFLNEEEALRRAMFSKEIKDELLAKIFIENFFYYHLIQITDDTNKACRIIRQMTAKISLDEIKNLSENWTNERLGGLPLILRKFFENKGIKIPKTETEIDEILKGKTQNQSN